MFRLLMIAWPHTSNPAHIVLYVIAGCHTSLYTARLHPSLPDQQLRRAMDAGCLHDVNLQIVVHTEPVSQGWTATLIVLRSAVLSGYVSVSPVCRK